MRRIIRSRRTKVLSGLCSRAAIALRYHAADNTVKITAVSLALVIYLILGGEYSLLSPAVVRQLFVNKLLLLTIDMAPWSLKLFAHRNNSNCEGRRVGGHLCYWRGRTSQQRRWYGPQAQAPAPSRF
jgi:hypothetical protein